MRSIDTQIPISGRFRTSSNRLPIPKLATSPQNISGRASSISGPGWMPWMTIAPSISAMIGSPGMPSVRVGTKAVMAAALFAASGPATPSMAPWPKRSGCRATWRSIA